MPSRQRFRIGPPVATPHNRISRSRNAAPTRACGQSTNTTPAAAADPDGWVVSRMLWAWMSKCRSVSPRAASGHPASVSTNASKFFTASGTSRVSLSTSRPDSSPSPAAISRHPPRRGCAGGGRYIGDGVRLSARVDIASRTRIRSSRRQGTGGWCPATSSKTNETHSSPPAAPPTSASSAVPSRRGAGTGVGRAAETLASVRWKVPSMGCAVALTDLAKQRRPLVRRRRAARPGEKPPGWVVARATGAPARRSMVRRTSGGRSGQATRHPRVTTGGRGMTALLWGKVLGPVEGTG
jgi:hypothetical protein